MVHQNKETQIQMKHQSHSSSTVSWQDIGIGALKTYAGALVTCTNSPPQGKGWSKGEKKYIVDKKKARIYLDLAGAISTRPHSKLKRRFLIGHVSNDPPEMILLDIIKGNWSKFLVYRIIIRLHFIY